MGIRMHLMPSDLATQENNESQIIVFPHANLGVVRQRPTAGLTFFVGLIDPGA